VPRPQNFRNEREWRGAENDREDAQCRANTIPTSSHRAVAGGWCPTGIREMLYNERYVGRVLWNRTKL